MGQQPQPRGHELERERQAVEASADGGDRGGVLLRQLEAGGYLPGALHQEPHGGYPLDVPDRRHPREVGHGERLDGVLPFAPHAQGRPARNQNLQEGAGREQGRDLGSGFQEVLEVVEHEQQVFLLQVPVQRLAHGPAPGLSYPEGLGDGRDKTGVGDRGQVHERDGIG